MNILHLGNPFFLQDFRLLGHDVKWAAYDPTADFVLSPYVESMHSLSVQFPARWSPDLVVVGDDSGPPKLLGLEALDVPLVWYAIDSHLHASWHQQYAAVFDVICVAQRDWVSRYRVDPDRQIVSWQPLFCHVPDDGDSGCLRDTPLSFVGTLNRQWNPERVALIEGLQRRYPIAVGAGAYREPFNRSLMVLNQSAANDVNFRTFQAMACGALLVGERIGNGFNELFQDRIHCALYDRGNVEQVIDLVEYYCGHPAERDAVARQGYEAVMACHTSLHRAQAILQVVATAPLSGQIRVRRSRQLQIQSALALVYESAARTHLQAVERTPDGTRKQYLLTVAEQYRFLATTIRTQFGFQAAAHTC
jgi:hypothetical protein